MQCIFLLLLVPGVKGLASCTARARPLRRLAPPQMNSPTKGIDPIDVQIIQRQFAAVRSLPRVRDTFKGADNILDVDDYAEPSFRRLFTHGTWKRYTGGSSFGRLVQLVRKWPVCSVLTSVWPCILIVTVWSLLVTVCLSSGLLARLAFGLSSTLQLQGTAIGLLLVFRTDKAYRRLEEARIQWARIIFLAREIVTKCIVCLEYPVVCEVSRYLCAFAWSLRDKLRSSERRDDILELLLDPKEVLDCAHPIGSHPAHDSCPCSDHCFRGEDRITAGVPCSCAERCQRQPLQVKWVSAQRSRPLAILGRVRRILYREVAAGELPPTQHYMIDCDVRELDEIVSCCERLFSSPIPPNMARHGMRSLMLWLFALPFMLAGQVPCFAVALCTATTAYIYFGLDELGLQVEQPFRILPVRRPSADRRTPLLRPPHAPPITLPRVRRWAAGRV